MSKLKGLIVILAIAAIVWAAERSAFDLMLQGHYGEAKAILNNSNLSPRYELLYYALTESEASRACSLFQVIAIRYPNTECDSVARNRLDQARDIGFVVIPIAEWSQAPANVRSLYASKPYQPVAVDSPAVMVHVESTTPQTPAMETAPFDPATPAVTDTMKSSEKISTESGDAALPIVKDEVVSVPVEARPAAPTGEAIPTPALPGVSLPSIGTSDSKPEAVEPEDEQSVESPGEEAKTETATPEATPVEEPKTEAVAPTTAPVEEPKVDTAAATANPVEEPKTESTAPVTPEPATPVVPEPVVKEEPKSAAAAPTEKVAVSSGHWFVQVGAFGNPDNAHRLEKKLQQAGYSTKIVPRETSKGTLLQVRVGGYGSRAELNDVMSKLKADFSVPTVVVSE
jgi:cell division protein FtsN